jgi:membrane protein required for colicin V production
MTQATMSQANMAWPDYAIIATVLISILVGFLRGFIKEVLSLAIWALAFFVAYQYGGEVAEMMEEHVSLPSARAAMGFSGLFVSVLLVGGLLSYLIGRLVESTGLNGTDRLLGGVFGAARGLALVVGVLLIAGFTPIPADPWWREAALIRRLSPTVKWAAEFLPAPIREQLDFEPKVESPAVPKSQEEPQKQGPDELQEEPAV